MKIDSILRQILALQVLSIPKRIPFGGGPDPVPEIFGNAVKDKEDSWLVPCSHRVALPATIEQIRQTEAALGAELPASLVELLRLHNGAELCVARRFGLDQYQPGSEHVRYPLFGTSELVQVNAALLANFRECLGDDPDYRHLHRLNYVAFGDAGNADYFGIGLEGERTNQVFLVHHELTYAPYIGDGSEFLYYTIADSLQAWFQLILDTAGWGGRGEDSGVL